VSSTVPAISTRCGRPASCVAWPGDASKCAEWFNSFSHVLDRNGSRRSSRPSRRRTRPTSRPRPGRRQPAVGGAGARVHRQDPRLAPSCGIGHRGFRVRLRQRQGDDQRATSSAARGSSPSASPTGVRSPRTSCLRPGGTSRCSTCRASRPAAAVRPRTAKRGTRRSSPAIRRTVRSLSAGAHQGTDHRQRPGHLLLGNVRRVLGSPGVHADVDALDISRHTYAFFDIRGLLVNSRNVAGTTQSAKSPRTR